MLATGGWGPLADRDPALDPRGLDAAVGRHRARRMVSYQVLGWGASGGGTRSRTRRCCRGSAGRLPAFGAGPGAPGLLRVWNLSLSVATFALTILGTFLTRSGVIQSVHSFSKSSLGPLLIGFFLVVVVVGFGLIAWRGDRMRSPEGLTRHSDGRAPSSSTTCSSSASPRGAPRHRLPAALRGTARPAGDGRCAVLQRHRGARRPRPALLDGGRTGAVLAQDRRGGALAPPGHPGVDRVATVVLCVASASAASPRWSALGSAPSLPPRRCGRWCSR